MMGGGGGLFETTSTVVCTICLGIRLKKSILCLKAAARIYFSVRVWFSKIQGLNFFACLIFLFSFLWTCLSKYTRKDMTDTMKHFEQYTSSTLCSILDLLHSKSSSIFQSCVWHKSDTSVAQKKKKKPLKTAFRSSLPICHELWDIAFIFFNLMDFAYPSHTFAYNCCFLFLCTQFQDMPTFWVPTMVTPRKTGRRNGSWSRTISSPATRRRVRTTSLPSVSRM